MSTDTVSVIFDGAKSFWKTRTNLDVLIVEHSKQLCYELIVYNATIGVEAPRIYLSSLLLAQKIDQAELQARVADKKEALTRAKKTFNAAELSKEVAYGLISQYILARLSIPNDLPEGTLTVMLMPCTGDKIVDVDTQRLDVICEKPNLTIPLQVARQKNSTASEFQAKMNELKSESNALAQATHFAELATSSVDGFKLMLAEKMRLELEMKRKYSVPRLRWINAINRILVQNYVAKVKIRLDTLAQEARYREEIAAANAEGKSKKAKKLLRKSVDNSDLSRLPSIKLTQPDMEGLNMGLSDTEGEGTSTRQRLPKVSQMTVIAERRRQRAAAGESKSLRVSGSSEKVGVEGISSKSNRGPVTRRSFGGGAEMYPNLADPSQFAPGGLEEPNDTPPSLIKSYHATSSKMLTPLNSNASEKNSSLRLVKI